jgi:hypothetical protein
VRLEGKIEALRRMTVANGCTPAEAETARIKVEQLEARTRQEELDLARGYAEFIQMTKDVQVEKRVPTAVAIYWTDDYEVHITPQNGKYHIWSRKKNKYVEGNLVFDHSDSAAEVARYWQSHHG